MSDCVKDIDDESVLKVICKRRSDELNNRRGFGIHLPNEKEFDKVIINENKNATTNKESKILTIVYGLRQALNVAKQYPTKYKQITIYNGLGDDANINFRNKYLLNFKDSYKNEIDELINNLKPIEVTFKHYKFNEESLNREASLKIENELKKINENVSTHVVEIKTEQQKNKKTVSDCVKD